MPYRTAKDLSDLADLHYDQLFAYVRGRVRSAAQAADIVQESWLRALIAFRDHEVANRRNFLFRTARNLVIDTYRRETVRAKWVSSGELPEHVACERPSAEREIIARQELGRLMTVVVQMPPRRQQVFMLRRFDLMDQAEIATALGITRGAVEKHLRLALVHLLTHFGDTR